MCIADFSLNPITDGAAVAQGLRDTAALYRTDQAALAARLLLAGYVIDELLTRIAETISAHDAYVSAAASHAQELQSRLEIAEFAARTNMETVMGMRR